MCGSCLKGLEMQGYISRNSYRLLFIELFIKCIHLIDFPYRIYIYMNTHIFILWRSDSKISNDRLIYSEAQKQSPKDFKILFFLDGC